MPPVTLIVTQRERFSPSQVSLDSLLASYGDYPFRLIYVDGNSPTPVRHYLERQAATYPWMTLILRERYLRSNEARNLALPWVERPGYVVFLDNDVVVQPGWLRSLVLAAEAEHAAITAPLILQGDPHSDRLEIHVAGIATRFHPRRWGKRWFEQKQLMAGVPLAQAEPQLRRQEVDSAEFHCLMVRWDVLQRVRLDEQFDSLASHTDVSFQVAALGGRHILEPSARVIFLNPELLPQFDATDLPFYRFKWSEGYTARNFAHAVRKWGLAADDPSIRSIWRWVIKNRQIPARLSVQDGSLEERLLTLCGDRRCPGWLRMAIEDWVLRANFPSEGLSAAKPDASVSQTNQTAHTQTGQSQTGQSQTGQTQTYQTYQT
ncbi:glycosyltransferase [Thermoleptolyngbya sichuanensis A183]|uniref:Glycosyltransferase n=1 Tax=Thermoleptolyngbya sichuanensis A183 TaxID=2737172 RepID=A0A6M8BA75_9CYAN|nr:glycosyltransferase family 2 protein [Thermoleptolyngbya sichuanensis]QKD84259.1 glycosyltransferase [Thermoleptolyngbya sichuanensis A183]